MALTKEDLQAIAELMDSKLTPINERLDQIQEDTTVTRDVVNGLSEWVEAAADVIKIKYPVEK